MKQKSASTLDDAMSKLNKLEEQKRLYNSSGKKAEPLSSRDGRVHRLLPASKVFFAKEKVQKHAFAFKVVQEQGDAEAEQEAELLLNGSTQEYVIALAPAASADASFARA